MNRSEHANFCLLSQGKSARAEHEKEGCEAACALDGREDTQWVGSPYYKWWKVDLESLCQIGRLRLVTLPGAVVNYLIEVSPDNLNWETVIVKDDEQKARPEGDSHEVNVQGRYVRVTITYNSAGEEAVIRHFEAYGRALEPSPVQVADRAAPKKFKAVSYDAQQGFERSVVNDIEPSGEPCDIVVTRRAGSYLVFRQVDFGEGVDQIRGEFGFPVADRDKRIVMEVCIDRLDGEQVGKLVLFRQWKTWSVLAGELRHPDMALLRGVHDVYLRIKSVEEPQQLMIHWLAFVKKQPLPAPVPKPSPLPAPASNFDYQIYFGNLHSHTGFSDGISVPERAYDYARYVAGLDFLAITEHSNLYDHYLDWHKSRKWRDLQRAAERKTENGKFVALYGSETTWYNQFGHMNTYEMDFFLNTYETKYNDIPTYYDTIKQYKASIHQWNHPWSCGNRHHDGFEPYDPELDEVMRLIEINPIEFNEMGGLYYYILALDKGWHVAPVGSQDNHDGQWGTMNNLRTGALVTELTREHLFDAIRHLRVYFTSALHLKCWFQINGAIMGSRISRTEKLDFDIKALYGKDTGRHMVRLQVFGEKGRVVHDIELSPEEGKQLHRRFSLPSGEKYYFIRIDQDDGAFLATAPIWVEN